MVQPVHRSPLVSRDTHRPGLLWRRAWLLQRSVPLVTDGQPRFRSNCLARWWVLTWLSLYFCSALSDTHWKRGNRSCVALNVLIKNLYYWKRHFFPYHETNMGLFCRFLQLLTVLINSFIKDSETFFSWRAFYWSLFEADGIILRFNYVMVFLH